MASILLEPGESFEHFHSEASYTSVVSGEVRFTSNFESRMLAIGERVRVPANHSHTVTNVGHTNARVDCIHSEKT